MRKIVLGLLVCALLFFVGSEGLHAHSLAPGSVIHIVQWGENLTRIAQRYGTSIQAIVQVNGLVNPNRIYVGQRLVIPTAGRRLTGDSRMNCVKAIFSHLECLLNKRKIELFKASYGS